MGAFGDCGYRGTACRPLAEYNVSIGGNGDPRARRGEKLASTDCAEAVLGLLKGVADEDRVVKVNALDGLRELSRRMLEEGLRLALVDPDPLVRGEAARVAPYYADETMERTLVKLASSDPDSRVRILAADASEACREKRRICDFGPVD